MAGRYHTVILVPHARAKLRKLRVSTTQLRVAVSLFALITLGAGFVTWSYFSLNVDKQQITTLRDENEGLREVNQSFENSIRRLQQQLNRYEERTRKLAIVAGLETLSGADAGIGGTLSTGDLDGLGGYLEAMQSQAAEMTHVLDQVEERLDEQSRWISARPSIAPVHGILTSRFGYRRDPMTGKRAFHPAVDIAAQRGHPVKAAADGVVVRAERIGGLGKAVYISHGFGVTTRYGHLSELAVEAGERIRRGDVIGYVGSTGRSTGYHVHYEVRVDGKPVNPLAYILDR